jgi:molybdenum cofactor cytidylyltransferase
MISGVVLAAGAGTRFGGTKQRILHGGKPLAQHAIDTLIAAGVDEILVITGHDAVAVEAALTLPPQARFVRNPRYADGQATSLAAAFHDIAPESEGAMILLADQPGVTSEEVQALIERFHRTRKQIVRAMYRDGPGPALLSREIYAEAGHLYGDVGARVLMASHPEWVEDVEMDRNVPVDVDRPEDLDRLST